MGFQAGLAYFDDRNVASPDTAAMAELVASTDAEAPRVKNIGPAILAFAATPLRRGELDIQPFRTESAAITFDGRLDNRDDLLLLFAENLRGETNDAALALAAYKLWGVDGFSRLLGDWSLAIWDSTDRAVILASDFAGTRPLYYMRQADRLIWSTRLAPFVDWLKPDDFDDEYMASLLLAGGCPDRTPYSGIESVSPGHELRFTANGSRATAFWRLPLDQVIRYQRKEEYEEHLRALFTEAVRCRVATDKPILAELSGGLDSSSVVLMANHLIRSGGGGPHLATLTLDHSGSLDTPFCKAVETMCGTDITHVPVDEFPLLTAQCTGGAVPGLWEALQSHTASIARERGAATYLTGRTGDLIMGNWTDDSDQVAGLFRQRQIARGLRASLAWSKALRIPVFWVLWKATMLNLRTSSLPADASAPSGPQEDSISESFRKRIPRSMDSILPDDWKQAPPERRRHFHTLRDIISFRRLQPPEPLQHLAYTHPLFHRPLVEYMMSIPPEIVCAPGEPRRLMRRALSPLWPPELRRRRSKDTFSTIFFEALRPLARLMLHEPGKLEVVERGYVEPASLKNRLQQLTHSLECNEPQLRQIILLEFWLRNNHARRTRHLGRSPNSRGIESPQIGEPPPHETGYIIPANTTLLY